MTSASKVIITRECTATRRYSVRNKRKLLVADGNRTQLKRFFIKKIICPSGKNDKKDKGKKEDEFCCIPKQEYCRLKRLDNTKPSILTCPEDKPKEPEKNCEVDCCVCKGCKICKKKKPSLCQQAAKMMEVKTKKKETKKKEPKMDECSTKKKEPKMDECSTKKETRPKSEDCRKCDQQKLTPPELDFFPGVPNVDPLPQSNMIENCVKKVKAEASPNKKSCKKGDEITIEIKIEQKDCGKKRNTKKYGKCDSKDYFKSGEMDVNSVKRDNLRYHNPQDRIKQLKEDEKKYEEEMFGAKEITTNNKGIKKHGHPLPTFNMSPVQDMSDGVITSFFMNKGNLEKNHKLMKLVEKEELDLNREQISLMNTKKRLNEERETFEMDKHLFEGQESQFKDEKKTFATEKKILTDLKEYIKHCEKEDQVKTDPQ